MKKRRKKWNKMKKREKNEKKREKNEVLARVMVLACDGWRCGSHGLSARSQAAPPARSRAPEGPQTFSPQIMQINWYLLLYSLAWTKTVLKKTIINLLRPSVWFNSHHRSKMGLWRCQLNCCTGKIPCAPLAIFPLWSFSYPAEASSGPQPARWKMGPPPPPPPPPAPPPPTPPPASCQAARASLQF